MADRVVSWKVVASFAQVRKEAERTKRSIDDLREAEAERDKQARDRERSQRRPSAATRGSGAAVRRTQGGGGGREPDYAKQARDLQAMSRHLSNIATKQKEVEKTSQSMSKSLDRASGSLASYSRNVRGLGRNLDLTSRSFTQANKTTRIYDKTVRRHNTNIVGLRRNYDSLGTSVTKLREPFSALQVPLTNVLSRLKEVRQETRGLRELDTALSRSVSQTTALSRAEAVQSAARQASRRRDSASRRTSKPDFQGAPGRGKPDFQGAPKRDKGDGKSSHRLGRAASSFGKHGGRAGKIAVILIPIITQLAAAINSLAAGFMGLVSVIGYAGGALAGFIPILTTAALGIGALFAAFSGVGSALGGYAQKQKMAESGTSAATRAAKANEKAARAQRDAQENLADTLRDNARRIEDAEDRVTDALLADRRAQEALTKARKDAVKQLRELREEVDSLALSEEEATLDLQDSREELARTMADPGASATERRRAEIAVQRAEEALRDARQDREEANEALAEAQEKGIENSDDVVDATRAQYDAQKELKRSLEDLAQTFDDNAKALRDAMEAIEDAGDAMKEAAAAGVDPFAAAMKKLPPIAQELVRSILALEPAWKSMKESAANATLPGFIEFFHSAIDIMDDLEYALVAVGGSISDFMSKTSKLVTNGAWQSFYRFLGDQSAQIIDVAGDAVLNYAEGLRYAITMMNPLTQGLMRLTGEWAENFKVTKEVNAITGESLKFYQRAGDAFELISEIVANLWEVLKSLGSAFYDVGMDMANGFANLTTEWVIWTNSVKGEEAMQRWGEESMSILRALGTVLDVLVQEWIELGDAGGASAASLLYSLADILTGLSDFLQLLEPLGHTIAQLFRVIGDGLAVVGQNGASAVTILATAFGILLTAIDWLINSPIGPFLVQLLSVAAALKVIASLVMAVGTALLSLNPYLVLVAAFVSAFLLWDSTLGRVIVTIAAVATALVILAMKWNQLKDVLIATQTVIALLAGRFIVAIQTMHAALARFVLTSNSLAAKWLLAWIASFAAAKAAGVGTFRALMIASAKAFGVMILDALKFFGMMAAGFVGMIYRAIISIGTMVASWITGQATMATATWAAAISMAAAIALATAGISLLIVGVIALVGWLGKLIFGTSKAEKEMTKAFKERAVDQADGLSKLGDEVDRLRQKQEEVGETIGKNSKRYENAKEEADAAAKAYEDLTKSLSAVGDELGGDFAAGTDEANQAVLDLAKAAGLSAQEIEDMTPEAVKMAIEDYQESVQYATQAERDLAEATAVLNNEFATLAEKSEALNKYIDSLNGDMRDFMLTGLDTADALDQVGESIAEAGASVGEMSGEGANWNNIVEQSTRYAEGHYDALSELNDVERDFVRNLYDAQDAMSDNAAAVYANTGSIEAANAAYKAQYDTLVGQVAEAFNITTKEAEEYVTTVLGIPKEFTTTVNIDWGSDDPAAIRAQLEGLVAEDLAVTMSVLGPNGDPIDVYLLKTVSKGLDAVNAVAGGQTIFAQIEGREGRYYTDADELAKDVDRWNDQGLSYDVVVVPTGPDGKVPDESYMSDEVARYQEPDPVQVQLAPDFDRAEADQQVTSFVTDTETKLDEADTEIKIQAKNKDAQDGVDRFIDKLDEIPGKVSTQIVAYVATAKSGVEAYIGVLDSIPEHKSTQIVAYVANAHEGINNYRDDLGRIPEKVTTQIVAYVADAKKGVEAYIALLKRIPEKVPTRIVAYVADAKKGVQSFVDLLNKIKPTYEVDFFVRNILRATELVDDFRAAWDGIQSKSVTLTVTYKETGAVPASGSKASADGGYVTYASGGQVSTMSRASARIVVMSRSGGGGALPTSMFKYASGGRIRGPGGPRDDKIPAWLSNGEYVINAASTSKFLPLLEFINSSYAAGGAVTGAKAFAVGGTVDAGAGAEAAAEGVADSVKATEPAVKDWQANMSDMAVASEEMTAATAVSFDSFVDITKESMDDAVSATATGLAALNATASTSLAAYQTTTKNVLTQVTQSWSAAAVGIGAAWAPVKQLVAAPARFVVSDVMNEGVIAAMNTLLTYLAQPVIPTVPMKFARGGRVPGHGNRDTVPAMLTPGEFVVKKSSAKRLGSDYLSSLNSGRVSHFAAGGEVPGVGNRDTVPAALSPGEFVLNKRAVKRLGVDYLFALNQLSMGGNVNAKKIYSWLVASGFTKQAASGVLGNLQQESGVNPLARQSGGPGRGIMQWTEGARWSSLTRWANSAGKDPWALDTQYQWMVKEMKDYGVHGKLAGMTSVEGAVRYFHDTMERSADRNMNRRNSFAYDAYNAFSGMDIDQVDVPSSDGMLGSPLDPNDPAVIFSQGFTKGLKDKFIPGIEDTARKLNGSPYEKMLQMLGLHTAGLLPAWGDKLEKQFGGAGQLIDSAFAKVGSGWPPQNTRGPSANTAAAAQFTKQNWPGIQTVGTWRASSAVATSDHPKGKALDIMIPSHRSPGGKALGSQISKWYTANPKNFGTKYVIYWDQVNSGSGWRPYQHPGGGRDDSVQHRDHVHVSLFGRGGRAKGEGSVPSLLTPGEFVIPQGIASAIGPAGLSRLNRGQRLTGGTGPGKQPRRYRRGGKARGPMRFHKGGPVPAFGTPGTQGRRFRGIKAQLELFNMLTEWSSDLSQSVTAERFPTVWPSDLTDADRGILNGIVGLLNQAAQPATAGTGGQSTYPGYHISRKSNPRAAQVKTIQSKIGVKADGIFGPVTESAVKAWQRDKALRVDGIVGPNTWNSLFPPTGATAGTGAGDTSVYTPATMAAKLGVSVGTLLRLWKDGSEVITEGVQEDNRKTFWDNMTTLDKTFADDLRELQGTLGMNQDGLWSVTMDEPVQHALLHGMGLDHDRWLERPWNPFTDIEVAIREQERANALREEWDGLMGTLYSWGLAYLVQDLKNKGIDEGMATAKSAVLDKPGAQELDRLLRESGQIKLEPLTEDGYLPIWVLSEFLNSEGPVGLRAISARFGMPDYKAYRSVVDMQSALMEKVPLDKLQVLLADLEKFKAGTYYMSKGGMVPGRGGGDTVPTMLSPGEYVIRKEVAKALGLGFLEKINSGVSLADLVSLPTAGATIGASVGVPDLDRATAIKNITSNITNNIMTTVNNPIAEPGSKSLTRTLRQKAALGVFGTTAEESARGARNSR